MNKENIPIFALSTGPQKTAIHLHRISGAGCLEALFPYLSFSGKLHPQEVRPRQNHYVHIRGTGGELIDDVLFCYFRAPHSYTGEDTLEICAHGNPLISSDLHKLFRKIGFQDAGPGEFTQRAWLNGKLDLVEAEAIGQMISAETWGALKLSRQATLGHLSRQAIALRESLIAVRAHLEAYIDFQEDEVGTVPWKQLIEMIGRTLTDIIQLGSTYERSKRLQTGLRLAIIGPPNAGKSTLFNALLQEERAIVTEEAGTTRDVIRETISVQGRDFVLSDTAGLRETENRVESVGIARTHREAQEADLVLCVLPLDLPLDELAQHARLLHTHAHDRSRTLVTLSKSDLANDEQCEASVDVVKRIFHLPVIKTSHDDVLALQIALVESYDRHFGRYHSDKDVEGGKQHSREQAAVLISQRQFDLVESAAGFLRSAAQKLEEQAYPEMIASDIIACEERLEELVGRIDHNDVFAHLFSNFCIGK